MRTIGGRDEWVQERGLTDDIISLSAHNLRNLGLFDDGTQSAVTAIGEQIEAMQKGRVHMPLSSLKYKSSWNRTSEIGREFVWYFCDHSKNTQELLESPLVERDVE